MKTLEGSGRCIEHCWGGFGDVRKGRLARSRSESLFHELESLVSETDHVLVIHLPDLICARWMSLEPQFVTGAFLF